MQSVHHFIIARQALTPGCSLRRQWLPAAFVALCLLLYVGRASGKDDTTFKPREYVPAKSLKTNTYQPKTYAPKPQTSTLKTAEAKPTEFKTLSGAHPLPASPMEPVTPFQGKAPEDQKKLESKPYTPAEIDHPSTITADKSFVEQEKKSFLVSSNNSPFVVTERPKERNPLLEPRQGIKAPEENPPAKDATK